MKKNYSDIIHDKVKQIQSEPIFTALVGTSQEILLSPREIRSVTPPINLSHIILEGRKKETDVFSLWPRRGGLIGGATRSAFRNLFSFFSLNIINMTHCKSVQCLASSTEIVSGILDLLIAKASSMLN